MKFRIYFDRFRCKKIFDSIAQALLPRFYFYLTIYWGFIISGFKKMTVLVMGIFLANEEV